jgi:predicted Rdx family selenoprotein
MVMVLAIVACVVGAVPSAQALLMLQLDDLGSVGSEFTITDNGLDDNDSNVGIINFASFKSGPVGNFSINVTTGITKPFLGNSLTTAAMKLSNVTITTTTGGTLSIRLTDTDFNLSGIATPDQIIFKSEIGGVISSSIDSTAYLDFGNNAFGTGGPSLVHSTLGPGAFSETLSNTTLYPGGKFSMTIDSAITLGAGSSASFDQNLTATTPEPSTLFLLVIGITGTAIYGWRRRKEVA